PGLPGILKSCAHVHAPASNNTAESIVQLSMNLRGCCAMYGVITTIPPPFMQSAKSSVLRSGRLSTLQFHLCCSDRSSNNWKNPVVLQDHASSSKSLLEPTS